MISIENFCLLVNSTNYSQRQMEYIYTPVEEVENPKRNELEKLLNKAERIKDDYTYYFLLEKWSEWACKHD